MPLSKCVPSALLQQLLLSQPLTCEMWSCPLDFSSVLKAVLFIVQNITLNS